MVDGNTLLTLEDLERLDKQIASQEAEQRATFESETNRFSEFLLEDNLRNIPKTFMGNNDNAFLQDFWIAFDKEMALTNLEPNDVRYIMDHFEIARLNALMRHPDYKLDFNDVSQLNLAKMKIFIKAKRSTGGINRERALIASQIRQFLTNEQETPKGGIFGRIGAIFARRH